jgi:hypothetical protein
VWKPIGSKGWTYGSRRRGRPSQALEGLREAWRGKRVTVDEIDRFARICRVERVMRPYVEALIA